MNELLNTYDDMTYRDYESHIQDIVDSITKGEKQDQCLCTAGRLVLCTAKR